MTDVLIRKDETETDTQEESHMMMEANIGVMGLQTKEYQKLLAKPEAKR